MNDKLVDEKTNAESFHLIIIIIMHISGDKLKQKHRRVAT
jgi:hypothetical protein